METVGRQAGFLLDRMRRRPRPRNRQTRKSLCQAGHEEGVLDLGANGSGSIDNEVWACHRRCQLNRHTRLRRTAPPVPRRPDWRAICTPGCALLNHRQRFATTGTAASPAAAFGSGVGFIQRRRRHGDHGMSGNPAASSTIRFGSAARISRWLALALPPSAISASDRPQPVQWPARASSAQISMQGDFGV